MSSFSVLNSSRTVEMSVSIANFSDEEKKSAFTLFEQALKLEQIAFQMHKAAERTWDSKVHEDFFNYNKVRTSAIDNLVAQHRQTHFPILLLRNSQAVESTVDVCMGTYADKLGVSKDKVYKVMLVNCSYLGTDLHTFTTDMAKVVGDLIASNPAYSCAVVICSNVGSLVSASAAVVSLMRCAG